jgi:hypothetical protein
LLVDGDHVQAGVLQAALDLFLQDGAPEMAARGRTLAEQEYSVEALARLASIVRISTPLRVPIKMSFVGVGGR